MKLMNDCNDAPQLGQATTQASVGFEAVQQPSTTTTFSMCVNVM